MAGAGGCALAASSIGNVRRKVHIVMMVVSDGLLAGCRFFPPFFLSIIPPTFDGADETRRRRDGRHVARDDVRCWFVCIGVIGATC